MSPAEFHARDDLEELVARMIVPEVQKIVDAVEREAKRQAPATKKWVTRADPIVRKTHRAVHGDELPENLRFKLTAYQWDIQHPGSVSSKTAHNKGGHSYRDAPTSPGAFSFMDAPRDHAPGHLVQVIHCRCILELDENGVAKMVHATRAKAIGKSVTATVYAEGEYVVPAEYGDVYPGNVPPAKGTFFMHKTVAAIGARARV